MNRRFFLFGLASSAVSRAAARPVRITKLIFTPVQGRFHKFVAMNSYDTAPKGHTYTNTLVRIQTDQGVEGVGVMEYALPDEAFYSAVKSLLGANPLEIYQRNNGFITGRATPHEDLLRKYKHLDGPLFDLIGKLESVPCWRLIGEPVREKCEVYDGTLYFSDVWFPDRGAEAVVEEVVEAQRKGYLGVKLKVGRGWKWMQPEEGLERDIAVLKAVRKAVGPQLKIKADANNGFRNDAERGWRLLAETRDVKLTFIEELFPESVEAYKGLRARLKKEGIDLPIADGENLQEAEQFTPYLQPERLMDVVQLDIRRGGFVENIQLANMAGAAGAISLPHNWGSQVGVLMGLHMAKATKSVTGSEDDRSTCDAIIAEGYEFKNGFYTVSNEPGLGIRVNEPVYREKYLAHETILS
jgi:L-alanine-DL-glutamate epimerase-like enolase superfamily enzyme